MLMHDIQRHPYNLKHRFYDSKSSSIISPLCFIARITQVPFRKETANENKFILDQPKLLRVRALPSLHGESLEIALTVS